MLLDLLYSEDIDIKDLEKYKLIITDCCHSISVGRENELCFFLSMCQR